MKLNHLDLQFADVPAAATFFIAHFGFTPVTRRDSPALVVLDDGDGFTLVLQRRKRDDESYPEGFHVGFIVDDPATVRARREALAAAGLRVGPVETNGRGTQCYLHGPEELLVEVSCRRTPG